MPNPENVQVPSKFWSVRIPKWPSEPANAKRTFIYHLFWFYENVVQNKKDAFWRLCCSVLLGHYNDEHAPMMMLNLSRNWMRAAWQMMLRLMWAVMKKMPEKLNRPSQTGNVTLIENVYQTTELVRTDFPMFQMWRVLLTYVTLILWYCWIIWIKDQSSKLHHSNFDIIIFWGGWVHENI